MITRRSLCGPALLLLLGMTVWHPAVATEPGRAIHPEREFWSALETFQMERAGESLADWGISAERTRGWRFAAAMNLLQQQPRTSANVMRALAILEELRGADDEVAVAAHYYVARIFDYHSFPPDRRRATEEYRSLLERFPGRLAAEMAFASLAINSLFTAQRTHTPETVFEELEQKLRSLRHPEALRAGHHVLGDAALRLLDDRPRAIRHLEALWSLNPRIYLLRADVLVKLGELNLSLGRLERAAQWYRLFLHEFSDEPRASWIEERLIEATRDQRKEDR